MSKPIRIFYSEVDGRLYASQNYSEEDGYLVIIGKKHDVTDDIGKIITEYELEFSLIDGGDEDD